MRNPPPREPHGNKTPRAYWLPAVALVLALLAATGCEEKELTISMPVMTVSSTGATVPMLDENGGHVMQTFKGPAGHIAQILMAKDRRPYFEQEISPEGKITKQTMWGENGRSQFADVDPDGVKYLKALAPYAGVLGAGVNAYFGVERDKAMWSGLGGALGSRNPGTVNVNGGSYVGGNVGTGTWQFNPTTTTTTDNSVAGQ